VAGVFTFGFNIWHSVLFNNASTLLGLANGLLPLRRAQKVRENRILSMRRVIEISRSDRLKPLI
jgi:hypothetical protein